MLRFLWIVVLCSLCCLLGCGGGGGGGTPPPAVGITTNLTAATLAVSGKQTFTATITNATNTVVTWSIQEGAAGGSITTGGVYTAPNTAGTYHVIVTSQADTTQQASAAIVVQAGSASGTIQ